MAILSSDLKLYLTGGAGNSNPNNSLGGAVSTTEVVTATEQNLFANVGAQEANDGSTKYRCVAWKNTHGTLTLQNSKVWIPTQTPSTDTSIEIALAGEGLNTQPETVADENTAPIGESFSAPATKGAGLNTGNIPAGQYYAVWEKRIVTASASAYNNDDWELKIEGDTDA